MIYGRFLEGGLLLHTVRGLDVGTDAAEGLAASGYVEVSAEDLALYESMQYVRDAATGRPVPAPRAVLSEEQKAAQLEMEYKACVQAMLDEAAFALGYTGPDERKAGACASACSYVDTGVAKFDNEGRAFRTWRSAVWERGYELLGEVKRGLRPLPAKSELAELLPKLEVSAIAAP